MAVCGVCKDTSNELNDVKCLGPCGYVFHVECIKSEYDLRTRSAAKFKCREYRASSSQGSTKSTSSSTNALSKDILLSVMESFKKEVFAEMESFKKEVFTEIVAFRGDVNELSSSLQFMSDKMDSSNKLMEKLSAQFTQLKKENEEIKAKYAVVDNEVRELRERVKSLEQYSRVNNIEVNGLPVTQGECVGDIVKDLGAAIGVEVQGNDISAAHRVPSYNRDTDQPLIIQFTNRTRRDEWISKYRAKKPALTAKHVNQRFPSQRVYINDHLSPENKQLLAKLKKKCREIGYTFAWCRDAKFFARKSEGDPVKRINTFEDIEKLKEQKTLLKEDFLSTELVNYKYSAKMITEDDIEYSPACNRNQTEDVPENKGFMIKVLNVENMIFPRTIIIKLDFCGKSLSSSPGIALESSETKVQWEFFYELPDVSENLINNFAANPFVLWFEDTSVLSINALEKESKSKKKEKVLTTKGSTKRGGLKKENSSLTISKKSSKSRQSRSQSPTRKLSPISPDPASRSNAPLKLLGIANLDIVPLLVGENHLREVLLIHATEDQKGSQATAWTNLPRLHVLVTGKGSITNIMQESIDNILYLTVETLHNTTPHFNKDIQAATVVPQSQDFEVIKFTNSVLAMDNLTWFSKRKKWRGLSEVQGQGALSSYKLCENFLELINTMDHELSRQSLESVPRIQWNQLHRSCLNAESHVAFKQKLISFRCWPVEILISNSTPKQQEISATSQKSGKKSPKESPEKVEKKNLISGQEKTSGHYITFLDMSKLLYPGVTSIRVASQLYTYVAGVTRENFGSELYIYETPQQAQSAKSKSEKVAKSVASKKDQSGPSTAVSSKKGKTAVVVEMVEDEPPQLLPKPEPVYDDNGNPIFIVVQVELFKPLIPKKDPEEVLPSVQSIIPSRPLPTEESRAKVNSTLAFEQCIEYLAQAIHSEYQRFYTNNEKGTNDKSCKNFLMHLHMTGAYTKMKESVKESVEAYVYHGLGIPKRLSVMKLENQNTVIEVYSALVEKISTIVNSLGSNNVGEYNPRVTCDDLLYFAAESMEEDAYDKAQEYLLQRIENTKKSDPQYWIDYAMFWVKKMEFEKAGECAREAISLDSKNIPALFFYGLLSWLMEDFDVAEQFLLAVVAFDPHSLEGWVALHIFHKQMNDQLDAVAEVLNAKMCIKEGYPLLTDMVEPSLSWCPRMVENDRVYMLTAIHMIKLSFPELAELALSYDLLLHGKSVSYLYYLAVCHYKQGRFADSLSHLEEALKIVWEDNRLWALKGHNLYKLKLMSEAKEAYQFAMNCPDTPYDAHLVNLRLGNILKSEGNHKDAHKYYVNICKQSPTPLSWLGLGITNFMDDEMKDAELALSEANMLDGRMSHVWGYLALVNLMMARPSIFNQCVNQALRFGLDDPVLIERLNVLRQFVKPSNC